MKKCNHKINKKMGYVERLNWIERKIKMGHKQQQCKICKLYLFKCER